MDNIIWKELSEDDLVFKTGVVLSSPNLQTGSKQQILKKREKDFIEPVAFSPSAHCLLLSLYIRFMKLCKFLVHKWVYK